MGDHDEPADVFVAFGITGDLARQMTFYSLYRLESRGLLDCPIVGVAVDDWSIEELRARAREAIAAHGDVDADVFARLAGRLSYVRGDFGDPGTFTRLAKKLRGRSSASSTSRSRQRCSPPSREGCTRPTCSRAPVSSSRSRSDTT